MKRYLALTLASALLLTNVVYAAGDATSSASETTTTTTTSSKSNTATVTTKPAAKPAVKPVLVTVSETENTEGYVLYTVVSGDNLSKIAGKYNTTWQELASLNGITHRANLIFPGEVFKIPGTKGSTLEPVTPEVPVVTPEVPEVTPEVPEVTPEVPVVDPQEPQVDPVPPVEEVIPATPIEPSNPVVETKNLKDGIYVGINGDYTTSEDLKGWDYFVEIEVKDGTIVDVNWDAKSELASTNTKKEQSEAGLYGMKKASALGLEWHEQVATVEQAFLDAQSLDIFEVNPETKKLITIDGVDATTSVSIKVNDFVKYAEIAMDKARGNLPATETVDTISSASLSNDAAVITQALSADGNWLVAAIGDTVATEHIVVEGEFRKSNATEGALYRKFTPSNHVYDADGARDRSKEEFFVFTAEKGMTVKSENLNLVNGTFVGDITVDAPGFTLSNMTVIGNVNFTSQEYRDSAKFKNSNVTGDVTPFYAEEHLNDGTYTGKVEGEKYNDVVSIVVRYGSIANVNYNPLAIVDGVETTEGKKELVEKGEYTLPDTASATWLEQVTALESYVVSNYNELEVDTITGATISIDGFLEATKIAIDQAK